MEYSLNNLKVCVNFESGRSESPILRKKGFTKLALAPKLEEFS